jgi:hypothetical protein
MVGDLPLLISTGVPGDPHGGNKRSVIADRASPGGCTLAWGDGGGPAPQSPQLHRNDMVDFFSRTFVKRTGGGVRAHRVCGCRLLAVLLACAVCATVTRLSAEPPRWLDTATPPNVAAADYARRLAQYTAARQVFEETAVAYWNAIADKRRARNLKRRNNELIGLDDYVLTQPPVYSGPPAPIDPSAPVGVRPVPHRKYVPVATDFRRSAAEHFRFTPRQPRSEAEFKQAYAAAAAAAGLTLEQVVRIYAFESGGNGRYDVQAGLERNRPGARAIYTAFGYNQLVGATSIELLAEKGDRFVDTLRAKAEGLVGAARASLCIRLSALKRMIAFARTVPDQWREHEKLAETPRGIGIHAVLLDVDIGPLLQTQKLIDSIEFARRQAIARPLTAVELQMMNLTGDGNGLDIVLMPRELRAQVPTANFFVRAGYERNMVAIRHNVLARLMAVIEAKMDADVRLQGARDMAAAYRSVNRSE